MLIKILRNHILYAADGTAITFFKQPRCNASDEVAAALIGAKVAEPLAKSKPAKLPAKDQTKKPVPERGKRENKE